MKVTRQGNTTAVDSPLLQEYTSKSTQQQSLIFNPTMALTIKSADPSTPFDHEIRIPLSLIYQFSSVMYDVAEHAVALDRWTTLDPDTGRRVISSNEMHIRKFSIYNAMLFIEPTLIQDQNQKQTSGVILRTSDTRGVIGTMYTYEVSALCDTISHIDVTTYSLIAAMAEQNTRIEHKVDMILERLPGKQTSSDVYQAFQSMMHTHPAASHASNRVLEELTIPLRKG